MANRVRTRTTCIRARKRRAVRGPAQKSRAHLAVGCSQPGEKEWKPLRKKTWGEGQQQEGEGQSQEVKGQKESLSLCRSEEWGHKVFLLGAKQSKAVGSENTAETRHSL